MSFPNVEMIYLDVTSSCRSAQNAGMQRMTRKIYVELSTRVDITPLCWNEIGRFYQRLGPKELQLLTNPFEGSSYASARPESRGQNPVAEFLRFISLSRFQFESLTAEDIFLAPDILHDTRRWSLPKRIAGTKARTVAIFHDATSLRLTSVYNARRRTSRYRGYIELLAEFDLVISISQEAQDDLHYFWRKFGCEPTATCLETWPVEFDPVPRGDIAEKRQDLVIYVSSLDPRKNHLTLLAAAQRLWDTSLSFELQIIGRATNCSRKIVKQLELLRRLGKPVRWLQHVDDATLLRAYRDCRFTVYPSLMEGFGLPIAESLWHGKPCICGGNGALGEVARGGGCLIVDQTSTAALAEGIKTLLSDRQLYSRLSSEARSRKFRSWSDYIDKLLRHLSPDRPPAFASSATSEV
jgi:glycosyltransferase involved in cell wall biosynthesis